MQKNRILGWSLGAVLAIGAMAVVSTVSHGQKSTGSVAAAKQWLAAMDPDNDGTVSKAEFSTYMDAQFDKVDTDHDGTLDAKELEQLRKNLALTKP